MKKKYIFITFFSILISIISIGATFAFLTDKEEVINTYSIGKVSITLDEVDTDELGVPVDGASRVHNNDYHLMPGYTYEKDPTITVNAGSNNAYVRMLLTINKIKELEGIFGSDFEPGLLLNGLNNEIWVFTNVVNNDDTSNTYEYRYYKIVNGYEDLEKMSKKLEPLFESFMISEKLNGEQLKTIEDLQMTIIGQAIQADGFDGQEDAWDAFEVQFKK